MAPAANMDLADISAWTARHFGKAQARSYTNGLLATADRLRGGPFLIESRDCSVATEAFRSLHMTRPGRHILIYHVTDADRRVIEIVRILHDAMDLPRHLSPGP